MKTLAVLLLALTASGADDGFAKWWPQFQSTVAKSDAKAITEGSKFPMQWELKAVREIKTREDFVAHFAAYFTADMKKAVANGKPVARVVMPVTSQPESARFIGEYQFCP